MSISALHPLTPSSDSLSGFSFPLPGEKRFSLTQATLGWWQNQYQRAVVALRKCEVELAASRRFHQDALQREQQLQERIKELEAKLRQREKELFGRRSEQPKGQNESTSSPSSTKRARGQQKHNPAPKPREHSHLPAHEEFVDLAKEQKNCFSCGLPFVEFHSSEDSEAIEVEIKAHRRVIRRKRYKKSCQCPATPTFRTAEVAPKLIPKSLYGISVWVEVLLSKYLYHQPTYRFIRQWEAQSLFLSQSTITGGLQRILPLLEPIYEAMVERQLSERHWHADETRWMVFEPIENKNSSRWYLWVVHSASAVIYILDPSRSAQVIKEPFGENSQGILSVERYSAYKAMAKVLDIILAFCWAHVRRDFLKIASSWAEHEAWALAWVAEIGALYHLNKTRLQFNPNTPQYSAADFKLRGAVKAMEKQCEQQLQQETLPALQEALLQSLKNHWLGLTLFVKYPHIPMDNNTAERDIRPTVIGRKNYFGSGSVWSGTLAALSFSLTQTLLLHQINPHPWFNDYFKACAQAGGNVPHNYLDFLPWNLTAEKKVKWACTPAINDSS